MKDFGLKTTFANGEKINHFLNKSHCVFLELFKWIALIKIQSLKLYCFKKIASFLHLCVILKQNKEPFATHPNGFSDNKLNI